MSQLRAHASLRDFSADSLSPLHVRFGTSGADEGARDTSLGASASRASEGTLPPVRERKRRTRLAVNARRAQLIELGFELFRSRGYDELSIEEIAAHAQISKGLLYHYFRSKRDYYTEVVRTLAAEFLERAQADLRIGELGELNAGLDQLLDYVCARRSLFAALMPGAFGTHEEVSKIVESTRRALVTSLSESVGDASPNMRNALRGWIGFAERATLDWIDNADFSRAELRVLLTEVAGHAVAAARRAELSRAAHLVRDHRAQR